MSKHLQQAVYNQYFHDCIDKQFENEFFDWKMTILFYGAVCYLQALAEMKDINIGRTDYDIEQNINLSKNNATMRISRGEWGEYKSLLNYSRKTRYELKYVEVVDENDMLEEARKDHSVCLKYLDTFKKHLKSQGLDS